MLPFYVKMSWPAKQNNRLRDLLRLNAPEECSLAPGEKHGWKPRTMRPAFLVPFALVCVAFAAVLELLAQRSLARDGLAIVKDADSLPASVRFAQSYLSTIIATAFGLAWSWVDLDVKRMEPWLQISRAEGATGRDSLFLEYPYNFVAAVPFMAARRRHWATYIAGTVIILIFYAITPLQSAIFSANPISVERTISMTLPNKLVNVSVQVDNFASGILQTQYQVNWHNQTYGPFTTASDLVRPLLPIWPAGSNETSNPMELSGPTTRFWSELECEPVGIWGPEELEDEGNATYKNDIGCEALSLPSRQDGYTIAYVGYAARETGMSLGQFQCPESLSNHTLTIWMGPPRDDSNLNSETSATLCTSHYYKQQVRVTWPVSETRDFEVVEVLSAVERLSPSEFNNTAFESLLLTASGDPDLYQKSFRNQTGAGRLLAQNVTESYGEIVDTIVGLQDYPVTSYADPEKLAMDVQKAHSSVFSIAVGSGLITSANDTDIFDGRVTYHSYGVVVSRTFSAAVEAALILVAILVLMLAWICRRSPSMLSTDPGPLSSLIKVIHGSDNMLEKFSSKGHLSTAQLNEALAHERFQLICGCQDPSRGTHIQVAKSKDQNKDKSEDDSLHPTYSHSDSGSYPIPSAHYNPITVLPFSQIVGIAMETLLIGVVVLLAVIKQKEKGLGGLSHVSTNESLDSFVTEFIPTAFATLMEPLLVLLNRLLCVLQPFNDLVSNQQAKRKAESSLHVHYASMPPQLAIWNAAKSKHYYLTGMCATALLANLLAISLSALFYNNQVVAREPIALTPQREAKIVHDFHATWNSSVTQSQYNMSVEESSLVADRQTGWKKSDKTPESYLPWMTEEFTFMPLSISSDSSDRNYSARTVGIGAEPSCHAIGPIDSSGALPELDLSPYITEDYYAACPKVFQAEKTPFNASMDYGEGPVYFSLFGTVIPKGYPDICHEPFITGWVRADPNDEDGPMTSSYVVCSPILKTAVFDVSFDSKGFVSDAHSTGQLEDWNPERKETQTGMIVSEGNYRLIRQDKWVNETWIMNGKQFHFFLDYNPEFTNAITVDTPFTDPSALVPFVDKTYKFITAAYMGIRLNDFQQATGSITIEGTANVTQSRLFISDTSIYISLTVITIQGMVLAVLYLKAFKTFLPRMPTSVGSQIAYVATSSVVRDYATSGIDDNKMLGFGTFIDDRGRTQVGINYDETIVSTTVSEDSSGTSTEGKARFGRRWTWRKRGHEDGV